MSKKGLLGRRLPKEQAAASESKGTGPWLNMLARLEQSCDGDGRRGRRDRLVDGSNERNDPKEDEGTEALGVAHRLWLEIDLVGTLSQLLG